MNKLLPALIGSLTLTTAPSLAVAQPVVPSSGAVVFVSSQWNVDSQEINDVWSYQTSATGSLRNNTRGTITTVLLCYQDIDPRTNQVYAKGAFVVNVNPVAPGEAINFTQLLRTDSPEGALQITQVQWVNQDQTTEAYNPNWQNNKYQP